MALLLKDNLKRAGRRAISVALLSLLFAVFLPQSPPTVWAEDKGFVLPESGIYYPGGFDANTIGEVRGKASTPEFSAAGPVQFRLASERETYIVLASPKWFWNDLRIQFSEGRELRVRGSKSLGRDGKLYIIAQEIQILPDGKPMAFRGADGHPLWKEAAAGSAGGRGSTGSSQGGMGRGFGGIGRGKR
jgi:hypothetical protein